MHQLHAKAFQGALAVSGFPKPCDNLCNCLKATRFEPSISTVNQWCGRAQDTVCHVTTLTSKLVQNDSSCPYQAKVKTPPYSVAPTICPALKHHPWLQGERICTDASSHRESTWIHHSIPTYSKPETSRGSDGWEVAVRRIPWWKCF